MTAHQTDTVSKFVLSEEQLHALHRCMLDILREIKRICEKNQIKYSLSFGTLLGAVRHQGFIPWDDDADVCMLREEYEKFKSVCEHELGENFYFQDNTITPGYRWGFGKIRMKGTKMVRVDQVRLPFELGVFVDIIPMDYAPQNVLKRGIHNIACVFFRKTLWSPVGRHIEKRPAARVVLVFLSLLPYGLVISAYKRFIKHSNRKATSIVRCICFSHETGYLCGHKRRWYDELKEYRFEDDSFPGTLDFEDSLTYSYGNWRELPPEDKRSRFEFVVFEVPRKYYQ